MNDIASVGRNTKAITVRWCVAAAVLLAGLSAARPAWAQTAAALPQSVFAASPLNDQQQQAVDQYVQKTTKQLGGGQPYAVARARRGLVTTLQNPNASQAFKTFYTQAVIQQLGSAIQSKRVLTRLNAVIVLGKLGDPGSAKPARQMLGDPSPAVRYWAAKAVGQIAAAGKLSADQQSQSLQALDAMVGSESSPEVLGQVLGGMLAIPTDQARQSVLDALNQRLSFHANHPKASYTAEREAIGRLFRTMVTQQTSGELNPQDLRRLARLAVLYMEQASRTLVQGKSNGWNEQDQLVSDFTPLLSLAGARVLPFAYTNLNMPGSQPGPIRQPLYAKQWSELERRALDWKALMTNTAWTYVYPKPRMQLPGAKQGGGQ